MNKVHALVISKEKCRLCGENIKMQLVPMEDTSVGIRYVCSCGDCIGKLPSITRMEQDEISGRLQDIIVRIESLSENLPKSPGTLTIKEYKNNIPYKTTTIEFNSIKVYKPYISLIKDRVKFGICVETINGDEQDFLVETRNRVIVLSPSVNEFEVFFDKEFSIELKY